MAQHTMEGKDTIVPIMENFLSQMRNTFVRGQFTGAEESKDGLGGTKDPKLPIQKTQSFKGEKRQGSQNWFQKQFSRTRSGDHDSRDMDHAVAIAAATFAINLQDISEKKSETPEASLTKSKSKVHGTKLPILLLKFKRLSGSFRSKDDQGKNLVANEKRPAEIINPAPSMKKTSTFTVEKPETSANPDPVRQPTDTDKRTKADEWERTQLEEIRKRYDKLRETIDSWENKKKMKARRKLNKEERELEKKRLKSLENFQNKIMSINKIADGAKTKAEESRKNEEQKAKQKANMIRTTGNLPLLLFPIKKMLI